VSQRSGDRIPAELGSTTGPSTPEGDQVAGKPRRRGWRWRFVAVALVICITVSAVTARLFIWPVQGMPAHVSAIVMLNGPGDQRLDIAEDLAWQHRASFVVISRGSQYWGRGSICAPPVRDVKVICFDPSPATTQGEAEFIGRLARKYGWMSLVLVTITPQDTRARLRVERCFSGPVYAVTASVPLSAWPYQITYEWAATVKALVFQRSC
jgi:hypothetical protein